MYFKRKPSLEDAITEARREVKLPASGYYLAGDDGPWLPTVCITKVALLKLLSELKKKSKGKS